MYSLQVIQPTYTYWSHEPEIYDLWSVVFPLAVLPELNTHPTYLSL